MTPEEKLVASGLFEIDDAGRVWRLFIRAGVRCERRRGENRTSLGYLQVRAIVAGKRLHVGAHRLVFTKFVRPLAAGEVINHLNGIKHDNRPSNIEATTYSGNNTHARRVLGLCDQRGEKNHQSKLTTAQVAEIRSRRSGGERLKSIAADFGVSDRAISKIALGRRWISEVRP